MRKQMLTGDQLNALLRQILEKLEPVQVKSIESDLQVYCDIQKAYGRGEFDDKFQENYKKFYQLHLLLTHLREGVTSEQAEKKYFDLLKSQKQALLTFEVVLKTIFDEITECWYGSFASKLIATIDDTKAVLDRNVLEELQVSHPSSSKKELRYDRWCKAYEKVNSLYDACLSSSEGKEFVKEFDKKLPGLKNLSSVKKIDVLLWEHKRQKNN